MKMRCFKFPHLTRNVSLVLVMLIVSPSAGATPVTCQPQTLDNYLVSDFTCDFGFGAWQASQFSLSVPHASPEVPNTMLLSHIFVTPFGGHQRAGFQFDLLQPLNEVDSSGSFFARLDMTIRLLSGTGIQSVAQTTTNLFGGPPHGSARVITDGCLGDLWVSSVLPCGGLAGTTFVLRDQSSRGHGDPSAPVLFDPVFLIDLITGINIDGSAVSPNTFTETPGGARLDSYTLAFNTNIVPEPATLALFCLGLVALGVTRRRRRCT